MRHNRLALFVFFVLLFFLNTFLVFKTTGLTEFDQWLYESFKVFKTPGWLLFGRGVTFLGDAATLYGLGGIVIAWLCLKRRFKAAAGYFVSLAVAFPLNALLKIYFGRPRPVGYDPEYLLKTYAYPSGHAFDALVFCFLTLIILSRREPSKTNKMALIPLTILVLAIGLSRLTLGVHWLSDVTGGFFLGAAWIALNLALVGSRRGIDDQAIF